jgi:hypothetical protein
MKPFSVTWSRQLLCAALVLPVAFGAAAAQDARGGTGGQGRGDAGSGGDPFLRGSAWYGETYGFGRGMFEVVGFPDRETSRARIRIRGTGALRVDRVRINDAILYPYDDYTVSAGGGSSDVTVNFLRGARPREGDVVEISGRTATNGEHVGRLQFTPGTSLPRDVERELAARGRGGPRGDFNRPRTGEEAPRSGMTGGPPRNPARNGSREDRDDVREDFWRWRGHDSDG